MVEDVGMAGLLLIQGFRNVKNAELLGFYENVESSLGNVAKNAFPTFF